MAHKTTDMVAYQREWYQKNKEQVRKRVNERRKELIEWLLRYKSHLKCERCPETHPACLDFHHLSSNNKSDAIAIMMRRGCSQAKILAEIRKCIVLCANCHRKEHFIRKQELPP